MEQSSKLNLALTDEAIQQVKTLLERDRREGAGLRVAVTNGGCSGYSYKLDFAEAPVNGDIVLQQNDVKIYVDHESAPYLEGMVIDFTKSLYGGGFKFTNPNATATCGCGTSFST